MNNVMLSDYYLLKINGINLKEEMELDLAVWDLQLHVIKSREILLSTLVEVDFRLVKMFSASNSCLDQDYNTTQ